MISAASSEDVDRKRGQPRPLDDAAVRGSPGGEFRDDGEGQARRDRVAEKMVDSGVDVAGRSGAGRRGLLLLEDETRSLRTYQAQATLLSSKQRTRCSSIFGVITPQRIGFTNTGHGDNNEP